MTTEEFYTALEQKTRETGTKWALNDDGELRAGAHCPLSFVAATHPCDVARAIRVLAVAREDVIDIVEGADCGESARQRRLLKACGLAEA